MMRSKWVFVVMERQSTCKLPGTLLGTNRCYQLGDCSGGAEAGWRFQAVKLPTEVQTRLRADAVKVWFGSS